MSELGRLLSEARTAKDLTLADVEDATRIRQKYLAALENGAYDELPTGSVGRGFLRLYARYLGVDVEQAIRLYEEESNDRGDEILIAETGEPRYVDYRPLEVDLMEPNAPTRWLRWLLPILAIGALIAGIWWLLNARAERGPISFLAPRPTATATETATPRVITATPQPTEVPAGANPEAPTQAIPEPPTQANPEPVAVVVATETPLPALTSDLLLLPTPTVPPTETPTPRPTATPEFAGAGIILDAEALQRTWVRVVADGNLVEEVVLRAGETRSWEAEQSITLRMGNAGGLLLVLNGEELGTLGDVGEVMERTWVVDPVSTEESAPDQPSSMPSLTPSPTPAG